MYIDTHLHLSQHDYDNIDQVITRAKTKKVNHLIVSACEKEAIDECLEYMNKYQNVYYTFGFHPSTVENVHKEELLWLENAVKSHSKIVGIGEIGLDYHYGKEDKEQQKQLFIEQLKIAKKLNLPVVIHSREAVEDTIDILKRYPVHGIIHCFSGSVETAKIYIKMGYLLGIGGVLTFTNSRLFEVIEQLSLDDIVLETDSPYLAPVPFRGQKNEPAYIPIIAEKIATIKQISVEEVASKTLDNARSLFDLPDER